MKESNFLSKILLSELFSWDVKRHKIGQLKSHFTLVCLSDLLINQNKKIKLDKNKKHAILGVNNNTGIFDAYIEQGDKINQPYKKMENEWLAYNPYRINVGSIGIKLKEHKHDYISPAYVVFSCRKELSPFYLFHLFKTEKFNSIIRENTTGSVRQNLSFDNLVRMQVPLPSLEVQNKIVQAYEEKIHKAEIAEQKSKSLEIEIENYLYQELGIEKQIKQEREKGLKFVNFSELTNRWDSILTKELQNIRYPLVTLEKVYIFVNNRRWDKKEKEFFRYVELGNVDPLNGIMGFSELKSANAPSRATQQIKTDDLIIGTTRPYLKRFAIVEHEYNDCIASSGFQIINNTDNSNLKFLLEALHSEFVINQFEKYMTGALYPAITINNLKKIQIPFPPLEKQNEIVDHISKLKNQIKVLNQKAEDNRKQAIIDFENTIFND